MQNKKILQIVFITKHFIVCETLVVKWHRNNPVLKNIKKNHKSVLIH